MKKGKRSTYPTKLFGFYYWVDDCYVFFNNEIRRDRARAKKYLVQPDSFGRIPDDLEVKITKKTTRKPI